jgi:acyl carrier protein
VSDARIWLVEFFESNGQTDGRSVEELTGENYVSIGLLDSLGIVQMLVGLEDEFGVWLDPAEMQDPRFCSIEGLAELVEQSRARA